MSKKPYVLTIEGSKFYIVATPTTLFVMAN
jgi:hypothetical protein